MTIITRVLGEGKSLYYLIRAERAILEAEFSRWRLVPRVCRIMGSRLMVRQSIP